MDQIKIGAFIAEKRKEKGLTQLQLAEKLNVTDRAVSKWERGKNLPDSSIMLDLCRELEISVNDLLHGKLIEADNYTAMQEQKLLEMVREKERADKMLLQVEIVIGAFSLIILLCPIIVGALLPKSALEDWQRLLIVFSGFIPALVGFFFALRLEQVAGYYECQRCNHKYVPTYKSIQNAPHIGRTRYMRCPQCNQKSWQKKVITKD